MTINENSGVVSRGEGLLDGTAMEAIMSHPHRRPGLILGLFLMGTSLAPDAPGDPSVLPALAEARYRAALKQFEESWVFYRQARSDPYLVYAWSRLVLEAQQELSDKKTDQIAAFEAHMARMRRWRRWSRRVHGWDSAGPSTSGRWTITTWRPSTWLSRAKLR